MLSHHALRQHGVSNLQEARNVGAGLQVRVVLLGRLARTSTQAVISCSVLPIYGSSRVRMHAPKQTRLLHYWPAQLARASGGGLGSTITTVMIYYTHTKMRWLHITCRQKA